METIFQDIIDRIFPQNCGDILKVIEKSKNIFWKNPSHNKEMKERYLKIWDAG